MTAGNLTRIKGLFPILIRYFIMQGDTADKRLPLVALVPARPVTLHGVGLDRADSNTPVIRAGSRLLAFVSDYTPIGHTYRRTGAAGLESLGPRQAVRILDDPDPTVGKWIESVWRDASGRLYGWYHAEEVAPCPRRLFMPHIGALRSDDEGLTWHHLGVLLRPGERQMDCDFDNGFMVGGCGDFCTVPDRAGEWFHLYFSSYVADENQQGVCVARYPVAARDRPVEALELWNGENWHRPANGALHPLWPMRRGCHYPDPEGFWGPAVHFNRDLGLFVMLLSYTKGAQRDWRTAGICVSFNEDPSDPTRWSEPRPFIKGGLWYPQVVGLGPEDGDALAGAEARFFLSGFSAWTIRFRRNGEADAALPEIDRAAVDALFARDAPITPD